MQKDQEQIRFYRATQTYGCFSNFYPAPFAVGTTVYPTTQHYFQSKKFEGHPEELLVIQAKTPHLAFRIGRNKKYPKRADWEAVKQDIMYSGLRRKFETHVDLRLKLVNTGNYKLVEHTYNDSYWADGGDGRGKNRLGVLLMRLRAQFKKEDAAKKEEREDATKKEEREKSKNK